MEGYRLIGQLDPQKDVGKDMAVTFNLGTIKSEKYGEAVIEGHFLCMNSFSQFIQISDDWLEQFNKEAIEWAIKIGLIKENDKYYDKFLKFKIGKVVAIAAPSAEHISLRLIAYNFTFLFFFDDLISNFRFFDQHVPLTYQKIKEATEYFIAIIRGNYTHLDEIPKLDFPLFHPLCAALLGMLQEALLHSMDISCFRDELVNCIRAVLWEQEDAEHNKFGSYTTDEYKFSSSWTIATRPAIEAANLVKGIILPGEVREHPFYEKYIHQFCVHVALVNDIFYLKEEILSDDFQTENIILIEQKKYSLQKSIYMVIKQANNLMIDLKKPL